MHNLLSCKKIISIFLVMQLLLSNSMAERNTFLSAQSAFNNKPKIKQTVDKLIFGDKFIAKRLEKFNQSREEDWVSFDQYIAFMKDVEMTKKTKLNYERLGSVTATLRSAITAHKRKERIKKIINSQSGNEFSEIDELVSNSANALVDKQGRHFGLGFSQSLKQLKKKNDRVIVITSTEDDEYETFIEYRLDGENYQIRDKKYPKKNNGTEVIVQKALTQEDQNTIKQRLINKFKYTSTARIYCVHNGIRELINPLDDFFDAQGAPIDYETDAEIEIVVTSLGYSVKDQGRGMKGETIYESLLVPKNSTKEVGEGGEYFRYQKKKTTGEKSKLILTVDNIVIEDIELSANNNLGLIMLNLPINTNLPSARNEVSMDEIVMNGLLNLIEEINKVEGEEKYGLINGIMAVIHLCEKRHVDDDAIRKLKIAVKKTLKEETFLFLPDMEGIEYLDTGIKQVIYLDQDICPADSIMQLAGIERVSNFRAGTVENLYTVPFKKIQTGKKKIPRKLIFGEVMLIDKELYERNKNTKEGISLLNLWLNFYIGYGPEPALLGELTFKKKKVQVIETTTTETTQIEEIPTKVQEILDAVLSTKVLKAKKADKKFMDNLINYIKIEFLSGKQATEILVNLKSFLNLCEATDVWEDICPSGRLRSLGLEKICKEPVSIIQMEMINDDVYVFLLSQGDTPPVHCYIIKNNIMIGEKYDAISDIRVNHNNVFCKASKDDSTFMVKNGEIIGDPEGYDYVSDIKFATNGDAYFRIKNKNGKYVMFKNEHVIGDPAGYDEIDEIIFALNGDAYWNVQLGEKWFMRKNGQIFGENKGYDFIGKITFDLDGTTYCSAQIGKNWFMLNDGDLCTEVPSNFIVRQIIFAPNGDAYSHIQQNEKHFFLEDGDMIGDSDGYDSIDPIILSPKGDAYCDAKIGKTTFVLKNGKIFGDIKGYTYVCNPKTFAANGDVYYRAVINDKYFILKNGEILGDKKGYDHLGNITLSSNGDIYCCGKKGKDWFFLKNGEEWGDKIFFLALSQNTLIFAPNGDSFITGQIGNKLFILKNGEIFGSREGYNYHKQPITFASNGDSLISVQIGDRWFILKNGQILGSPTGYDKIIQSEILPNGDVYFIVEYTDTDQAKRAEVLKNGKVIAHSTANGFLKFQVIGNDIYILSEPNLDGDCDVFLNGTESIGKIKYEDETIEQKGKSIYFYRSAQYFLKWQKPDLTDADFLIIGEYVKNNLTTKKEKQLFFDYLSEHGKATLGDSFAQSETLHAIRILGESFYNYISLGLITEQFLKKLYAKFPNKSYEWWQNYWQFYQIFEQDFGKNPKLFAKYTERWDLLEKHCEGIAKEFITAIKDHPEYLIELSQAPSNLQDFIKFFNRKEIEFLDEETETEARTFIKEETILTDTDLAQLILLQRRTPIKDVKDIKIDKTAQTKHIQKELQSSIQEQSGQSMLFIRELFQNAIDAILKFFGKLFYKQKIEFSHYMRTGLNKDGKKEVVFEIKDPVGMTIEDLCGKVLVPDQSGKVDIEGLTGMFGIGFQTIFNSDYVEIETGIGEKNGGIFSKKYKSYFIRMKVERNQKNEITNIKIEKLSKKLHSKRQIGTKIRAIKTYAKTEILRAHIEALGVLGKINHYIRAKYSQDYSYKNNKRKYEKKSSKKKRIGIYYRGKQLIHERELLSTVNCQELGELKMYFDEIEGNQLIHRGLYVSEINPSWLEYVPEQAKDMIKQNKVVIEIPENLELVRARNDINNKAKYEELLKKAIAVAYMKAALYLHMQKGIRMESLSEDYLYKNHQVELEIIADAEKINADKWSGIPIARFKKYASSLHEGVRLITYLDPAKGRASLVRIKESIKEKASKKLKEETDGLAQETITKIKEAEEQVEIQRKENEAKNTNEDTTEELQYLARFTKWVYDESGIGFKGVSFYEKQEQRIAHYFPVYDKTTKQIVWNIWWNKKHVDEWLNILKQKDKTVLIYSHNRGDIFLQTVLHESTHAVKEYQKKLDEVLKQLDILALHNPSLQSQLEICKESYKQYFETLFDVNVSEKIVFIKEKGNEDIYNGIITLLGQFYLQVNPLDQSIINNLLNQEKDFGIKYETSHQSGIKHEDNFAYKMNELMESMLSSGITEHWDESVTALTTGDYIDIFMDSSDKTGFFQLIKTNKKLKNIFINIFEKRTARKDYEKAVPLINIIKNIRKAA